MTMVPARTSIQIALVDGYTAVRHARQLMLRAEGFDVRAYVSVASLLADPLARASACVIADVDMPELGGLEILQAMRLQGWTGVMILLVDTITDALLAEARLLGFAALVPRDLPDRSLIEAIRMAIAELPH
ncbi:response regulator [Sphingomonas echinoides]|uniref:Response regulator n=1 Tax=Sphingomonas echinoides TaxID=59803 RepID=A0ABU4PQE1_9SPHN|nr:response regulator [Sphingomonas echinoides]MDX5986027.1 response regulator [Sphingomonas echinoides]